MLSYGGNGSNGSVTWKWLAGIMGGMIVVLLTLSWNASSREHAFMFDAFEKRIATLEVKLDDARVRLTVMEQKHQSETLTRLTELEQRLKRVEEKL